MFNCFLEKAAATAAKKEPAANKAKAATTGA
jgi:hypothetical protein